LNAHPISTEVDNPRQFATEFWTNYKTSTTEKMWIKEHITKPKSVLSNFHIGKVKICLLVYSEDPLVNRLSVKAPILAYSSSSNLAIIEHYALIL